MKSLNAGIGPLQSHSMPALDDCKESCRHWTTEESRSMQAFESFNTGTGRLMILSVKQYAQAASCRMHASVVQCLNFLQITSCIMPTLVSRAPVLQYLPCLQITSRPMSVLALDHKLSNACICIRPSAVCCRIGIKLSVVLCLQQLLITSVHSLHRLSVVYNIHSVYKRLFNSDTEELKLTLYYFLRNQSILFPLSFFVIADKQ